MDFATITTPNFWAQTRVLASSLRRHNPQGTVHALLADPTADSAGLAGEPNLVVHRLDELALPDAHRLTVRFNLFELSCALKPAWLRHLLGAPGVDALAYVDSDVQFFAPPTPLAERLRQSDILLTPHFAAPGEPFTEALERLQFRWGTYNGGFFGVRNCDNARRFLSWWADRALRHSCEDPVAGVYVDQQWLDLVPGLFANVYVERHPGVNVARWNLKGRAVERDGDGFTVNGQPLIFFHYTQVRPGLNLCDYFWGVEPNAALKAIMGSYTDGLLAKGYAEIAAARGASPVDDFPDGRRVPALFRQVLRGLDGAPEELGLGREAVPPREALRRLAANGTPAGGELRVRAYHQARARRLGSAEEFVNRYRRSAWFRRWVNWWFYLFAPRVLHVPVEWVEPSPVRRRLRAVLDAPARLASKLLRGVGR